MVNNPLAFVNIVCARSSLQHTATNHCTHKHTTIDVCHDSNTRRWQNTHCVVQRYFGRLSLTICVHVHKMHAFIKFTVCSLVWLGYVHSDVCLQARCRSYGIARCALKRSVEEQWFFHRCCVECESRSSLRVVLWRNKNTSACSQQAVHTRRSHVVHSDCLSVVAVCCW